MSARSDRRRAELIRASNYYGEQAARAYLAGHNNEALTAASLAIDAQRKLARKGEPDVLDILADTLRDRAEIISVLALPDLYNQGIMDAQEGIELYREHGGAASRPAPLWIASVQVQLAELHAALDHHDQANSMAFAALADYRRHETADEQTQIHMAQALSRCANIMTPPNSAQAARREAVQRYRPWLTQSGHLWQTRFNRDLIWLSTPTLRRAGQTAWDHAETLRPPTKDTAPEALAALQDAAEAFAALITPPHVLVPPAVTWAETAVVSVIAERIAEWLTTIDATTVADAYQKTAEETAAEMESKVRALRPLLTPHTES